MSMRKKNNHQNILMAIVVLVTLALACDLPQITPVATTPPIPASTPTTSPGTIHGILWHEVCRFSGGEGGEPVVLGEGCVQWGSAPEEFGPNQILDSFETGWEGVTLHLGAGACPSTGLATTITDSAGEYRFEGLEPGTYCVSYSSLTDGNDAILIPGGPTYPERGEAGYSQTVTLSSGDDKRVDFGYAWQFYD